MGMPLVRGEGSHEHLLLISLLCCETWEDCHRASHRLGALQLWQFQER